MNAVTEIPGVGRAERLNHACTCRTLDWSRLCAAIEAAIGDPRFREKYIDPRPHLFSNVPLFISAAMIDGMAAIVAAIERAAAKPGWVEAALARAPAVARSECGPRGALMGYDFHLGASGPKLIEINTNAGGAFLNALLAEAQFACCEEVDAALRAIAARPFPDAAAAMFRAEWAAQRGDAPLQRIAIVDDDPEGQYLYPEFLVARKMLGDAGLQAEICDARSLRFDGGRLMASGGAVDLVYNRLTDFDLGEEAHAALRAAYLAGAAVVTPNPRNHALLADKRNLVMLSDPAALERFGVDAANRALIAAHVPRTVMVTRENADALWAARKSLFFKPEGGHASKGVYRGDKLTRGVWSGIVEGGFVAQEFAAPTERVIELDGAETTRKVDVRLYT